MADPQDIELETKNIEIVANIKTKNCAHDPHKNKIPTHLLHVSLAKCHIQVIRLPFPSGRYSKFTNADGNLVIFVFNEGQCCIYDILTCLVSP